MSHFQCGDSVTTIEDAPEHDLRHGEVGTIVHVYRLPNAVEAYDVAFPTRDGAQREIALNVTALERARVVDVPAPPAEPVAKKRRSR